MRSIKFFAIFLLLSAIVIPCATADQTITLQWDDEQTVDGFRLFVREQGANYIYSSPIWQGPEKTTDLTLPDGKYAAVVRAYRGDSESGDSNEVIFEISPVLPPIVVPGRPQQLTIYFK